jgi:hypothetical protein
LAWFSGQGIDWLLVLSPNGFAYKADSWRKAFQAMGLNLKKDQALHPSNQRQGSALWPPTVFVCIKSMLKVWAYVVP